MTTMEFFGCSFIAFGLPFAMFVFTIMKDPLRVIVLMASGFFWLLSLLISSLLWFAVVPLRDELAFGLVFSVLFQEAFRLLFYVILRKAEEGLEKVSQNEEGPSLAKNKFLLAYVSGFGFGLISGAFSSINVLADSTGPGTIGIHGHSQLFFITSALLTLCFILLHTFWGVVFFTGLDRHNYIPLVLVVACHMLVSSLTLLNQGTDPVYYGSIIPAYILMAIFGVWAYFMAGGSLSNLKSFILNKPRGYSL